LPDHGYLSRRLDNIDLTGLSLLHPSRRGGDGETWERKEAL
jgi:hypothetical protein